jgi:ERAP1-like C-terminal domain/Peptidase family M1 domain
MQYFGCAMLAKDSKISRILKGLETLLGYLITGETIPKKQVMESFMVETMTRCDSMTGEQIKEREENVEHWSTIKTASVLKMFQHAFTNSIFLSGLQHFIADNKNSAVTLMNFHNSLQKAFNESNDSNRLNITSIMTSWEETSGFPILKVQRSSNGLIRLTQKHSVHSSTSTFEIPVNFATKESPNFMKTSPDFWMNKESMVIDTETSAKEWNETSWVIFNTQRTGYYRVDYDLISWSLIINAMLDNHNEIIFSNRGQILDDLLYFIKEPTTPSTLYMDLLSYLINETDVYPWHEAQKGFEFFHIMLFGSSVYENLMNLFREVIESPYDKKEDFNDKTKRIIENVACTVQLEKCIEDAAEKISLLNSTTYNEKNLFDVCNALRFTEKSILEEYLDWISTVDKFQAIILIKGLSCSQNDEFLALFMSKVLYNEDLLETDEVYDTFSYFIQQNLLSVQTAISVLLENENSRYIFSVKTLFGIKFNFMKLFRLQNRMNEIIVILALRINSENLAARFDTLIARDISFLSQEVIRECQATVETNLEWVELNMFAISQYFLPKNPTTQVPPTSSDHEHPEESTVEPESTEIPNENKTTTVPDKGSQLSFTAYFYLLALINTIIKF